MAIRPDARYRFARHLPAACCGAVLLVATGVSQSMALAAKDGVLLAPHRAVYDMALDRTSGGDGVAAVRGRMVFDFAGSVCDGYTLNIRLLTVMTSHSGSRIVNDLHSSTWEHGEGTQFRFNTTHYQDEKKVKAASGEAAKGDDGPAVNVTMKKPEAAKLTYEGKILFPTQHSVEILNAALKGQRLLQARIFDGSELGRKLYATTAFIGKRQPPGAGAETLKSVANTEKLTKLPAWPVTISYFDEKAKGQATPAYELSFLLYENGVSRKITIDYGDFAIRGALNKLEFFKPSECK